MEGKTACWRPLHQCDWLAGIISGVYEKTDFANMLFYHSKTTISVGTFWGRRFSIRDRGPPRFMVDGGISKFYYMFPETTNVANRLNRETVRLNRETVVTFHLPVVPVTTEPRDCCHFRVSRGWKVTTLQRFSRFGPFVASGNINLDLEIPPFHIFLRPPVSDGKPASPKKSRPKLRFY